jgi:branched-chain amino acid transport system permease protein
VGALLYIGITSLNIGSYTGFVVPALSAALIGNLSNIWATVFGGLGLGMVQSGLINLAGKNWWPKWAPATGVRSVLPLLVVIGVLYFRGNKIPLRGAIAPPRQARVPTQTYPWLAPAVAGLVFGIMSIFFTSSWEVALTTTIVSSTIMMSMILVIGFLGQISLAQMSLAGVSAYALVRFASKGESIGGVRVKGPGLPHPIAALLAVAITVVIGLIIAAPALRIRGVQLAVVTMTAVIAIQEFVFRNDSVVGPGAKANNPVPRPNWFGWDVGVTYKVKPPPAVNNTFTDRWQFTIFALIWLIALVWMMNNLRRSSTGRRFLALRSNERAAASGGIDVARTKLLGFGMAAAIAAVGGILFAYKIQSVKFENFGLFVGLGLLAFAVIGGITTPAGAVVGGVLGAGGLVPFFFSERFHNPNFNKYVGIIGAIALVFNAIMNPEGVAGGLAFKKKKKAPKTQPAAEVAK